MDKLVQYGIAALILYLCVQYPGLIMFLVILAFVYLAFLDRIDEYFRRIKQQNKERAHEQKVRKEKEVIRNANLANDELIQVEFQGELENYTVNQLTNIRRERDSLSHFVDLVNFDIVNSKLLKRSPYDVVERSNSKMEEVQFMVMPRDEKLHYFFALGELDLIGDMPRATIIVKPRNADDNLEEKIEGLSINQLIDQFLKWKELLVRSYVLIDEILGNTILFDESGSDEFFSNEEIKRLNQFADEVISVVNRDKTKKTEEIADKATNIFLEIKTKLPTEKKRYLKKLFGEGITYAKKITHDVIVKLIVELIKEWGKHHLLK